MVIGLKPRYALQDVEPAPWDVLAMWDTPALWDVSYTIPSGLYNCRKYSTNHTFLCKTKPILKSCQCPQTILHTQLTEIFATFGNQKTKPIQSQTKPISKMPKMNTNCFIQRNYEQKPVFGRKKNKANSKPIPSKVEG